MSEEKCEICGEPMPPGEQMFKFHGYSGPCPKPPLPKQKSDREQAIEILEKSHDEWRRTPNTGDAALAVACQFMEHTLPDVIAKLKAARA